MADFRALMDLTGQILIAWVFTIPTILIWGHYTRPLVVMLATMTFHDGSQRVTSSVRARVAGQRTPMHTTFQPGTTCLATTARIQGICWWMKRFPTPALVLELGLLVGVVTRGAVPTAFCIGGRTLEGPMRDTVQMVDPMTWSARPEGIAWCDLACADEAHVGLLLDLCQYRGCDVLLLQLQLLFQLLLQFLPRHDL